MSERTVSRWHARGRLHRLYRGVYALGHPSIPIEGRIVAALLSVGRGAVLSHGTAAWWWGLSREAPGRIHISVPGRSGSHADVRVHHPRHLDCTRHRRLPVTTVARTLLDFAAQASLTQVRRALSEAEYQGLLNIDVVKAGLGQGRPGTAKLHKALAHHLPQLARTRSRPEGAFVLLCERARLPLPEINVKIGRMTVDAVWLRERLVAEIDTYGTHGSPSRMARDRNRELHLRAAGYRVVRYTDTQIDEQPELVAADLRVLLGLAARSA